MIPHLSDTNILLRLSQRSSPHYPIARSAVSRLRRSGSVVYIVPQNVVEFWSVATRPISLNGLGYSPATADRVIRRLERIFPLIPDNSTIHDEWRRLVVSSAVSGKQVHDARLVASMLAHGITHILTFNLADFRRYPGITVVDPATV